MPKIVLADDSPLVRESVKSFLERRGFEIVGVATDGLQAVDLVEALDPDLAILDFSMPRMSGIAATRHIREFCPRTRVILLTVHAQEHLILAAVSAGIGGYVAKANIAGELVPAIEEVSRGGLYLPCAGRSLGHRPHRTENDIRINRTI
jgi:DNA-binding NarL/FixJ family response regulator